MTSSEKTGAGETAAAPATPARGRPPSLLAELSAEFAGTMILILFGVGVVAQVVTTPDGSAGQYDSIAWTWGIGVMLGVYVAGRISGAHLNPAVTIAFAAYDGFPWRKVGPFIVAQFLGAAVAALIVRATYADLIRSVDPTLTETQGIFSTFPGDATTIPTAFLDQVVGTAILVFMIFALVHPRNRGPAANMTPFMIGIVVVGIGMAWGSNAGYAINPARDFGPRLVSWITGYENAWVTADGVQYWWLPIIAPVIGGLIGGGLFKLLVDRYIPADDAPQEVGRV
ncbi:MULTISPECIES: MIP/aquaporin family protein [Pseudonocardia]|uniref:Glycerol uptake facilitator protein n=2 Tax=Pseudonocardia TaxID=1847 RepID=A0A1Y2MVR0_PSEAH|nr:MULTISPECIES: MIP/aquaporin family protein [Pseudonocardia]OSY39274.1 Glycerol uptake facilitator protein [Pseudonocardia autotrophica]TDN76504.1 glycerol uptake facilitator protein [Pseudonocardia autotrophica]BBG00504.1 aquaporin [Pseudonocardia autotrophica]GEC26464.1 aquaporin [Pseudonocardia saturnea]